MTEKKIMISIEDAVKVIGSNGDLHLTQTWHLELDEVKDVLTVMALTGINVMPIIARALLEE